MTEVPWLWLLAGPNGAGKSTYASNLAAIVEEVVGPDAIAHQLLPTAPETATLAAGRPAVVRKRELLRERQSFAVETTLSGRGHLRDVKQAMAGGWNVGVIFIGLASSDLAVERVRQRKLAGGHDVPAGDIRRRYERSLRNLVDVSRFAELVLVLDNSGVRRPMRRVLEVRRGTIVFRHRRLPKWLRPALESLHHP
jgi:predicted ABC-type ATPase